MTAPSFKFELGVKSLVRLNNLTEPSECIASGAVENNIGGTVLITEHECVVVVIAPKRKICTKVPAEFMDSGHHQIANRTNAHKISPNY